MVTSSLNVASRLRPDLPAVEELRALARAERWPDFDRNLLNYMRNRPAPKPFFDPAAVPELMARIQACDPQSFELTRALADHALNWEFPNSTAGVESFISVGPDYDFKANLTEDPEFPHGMNRLSWMPALAKMARATNEPRYFDFCLAFWRRYVERVGYPTRADFERAYQWDQPGYLPLPWHRLDMFIRLTNLWWTYWLLLTAERLTPAAHSWMLEQILRQHDTVLMHGTHEQKCNWAAMQYEAQFLAAAMWPEFHGMEASAVNARLCLEESLALAFFPDGLHYEQSPSYGQGCLQWYGQPFLLALRNGQSWSPRYRKILRNAFTAYDRMATPSGHCPILSDSDPTPVAPFLTLGRALFPDLELCRDLAPSERSVWYGVEAKASPASVRPSRVQLYPQAGLAVVRQNGNYLTFDCGPKGHWHGHLDLLHIHYWLKGKMLLGDGGRWLYKDDALRRWAVSPAGHNTIAVEGRTMAAIEDSNHPQLEGIRVTEREDLMLLRAGHHAYDLPASHVHCDRRIALQPESGWLLVVDELTAEEPQTWRQHWLLPRDDIILDGDRVVVPGAAELQLAGGAVDIRPQAWSPRYAVQVPGCSVNSTAGGRRVILAMLLVPDGREGRLKLDQNSWAAEIAMDGHPYRFSAADWDQKQPAEFK